MLIIKIVEFRSPTYIPHGTSFESYQNEAASPPMENYLPDF